MKNMISPSLMCADFLNLGSEIRTLEAVGTDYLHIDIMDGVFVPNYTLGTDFVRRLHAATDIPLDIHLMITEPEEKLGWFELREGDYVSVHYEACSDVRKALRAIRERGAKAMPALKPDTPIEALDGLLDDLHGVLIMTVNPGFSGQKLVPETLEKIRKCREYLDAHGFSGVDIECDGNVSFENARKMRAAGANIFVGGTSSVYSKSGSIKENVAALREAIK